MSTFVNMGRNHRDRCWPWKKGNKLPYKRKANDMPLTGHGPNGEFVVHSFAKSRCKYNMVLSNNTVFFLPFFQVKFQYILALDPLDRSAPIFTLLVLPKIQCLLYHTVLELFTRYFYTITFYTILLSCVSL